MIIFLFINGFEPFGTYEILTISGNEDMLTNIYKFHDFLHGVYKGNDIGTIWSLYLSDPTNIIICLFPKDFILCLINLVFCIKLGLSGLFSFYLFKHTKHSIESTTESINKNIIALFLSFSYAFSGYLISYGMNIMYLSVLAIFPLYMLFLNRLIEQNEWKKYYILLSIAFIMNVYMSFLILVFSFIYMLLQTYDDLKCFLKTIYQKALADILAIGTTSFFVILFIKNSARSSFFCTDAPNSMCVTSFWDIFSRLLTNSVLSSGSDTSHGVDIYIGILPIFLIFLYIFNSKINIYDKIKKISLLAILFISTNVLAPNLLFNFFKDSDMNICFFGFELAILILLLSQETLYHINGISYKKVMIAFMAFISLIVLSLRFTKSYLSTFPYIISIGLLFIYALILILIINISSKRKTLLFSVYMISLFELVFSAYNGVNLLAKSNRNYLESNSYNFYVAENSIREVYPNANIITYDSHDSSFNPIFNSLNGVDFVLAEDKDNIPDASLEYVSSVNNINIFRNNYSVDGFIYLPVNTKNWVFNSTSPYLSSNELLNYASGEKKPLFTRVESAYADISEPIKDDAGNDSTERHDVTIAYKPESEGHIYSSFLRPSYLGYVSDEETSFTKNYDMTIKNVNSLEQIFCFYRFDIEGLSEQLSKLSISNYTRKSTQNEITIDQDGYILLSIGHSPSYMLEIDGTTSSNICVDNYLWLAPVKAGLHEMCTKNDYSFIPICIILSALAIIILLIRINPISDKSLENVIIITNIAKKKAYIFTKAYYVYIASILFPIGILMISCLINGCLPFGKASIMASDGYVQTYPSIQSMINYLSIKSLIPSKIGFGTLIFSCGYDYIASTLHTIIQLLFRAFIWTNDGKAYSAILAAFYMIISGPSIIFYLTHRYSGKRFEKDNPYLILISLFFTLSEYMIGYFVYSNFAFGFYVPIIIWAFEKMFYEKKPLAYILSLSLIMIREYYGAFLLSEFLIIYFFIQEFKGIKDFISKGLRFAITSILAAGISISTLLPAFMSTRNATYLESDTNITTNTFSLYSSIIKTISQYKAYHYGLISTTDDSMVNYYAGLVPLLFAFIYLWNNNISKSIRIRKGMVSLFFVYAFGNNLMNYVFHGFHFQSNVPNRFSIFFIFILLTMFADSIQYIKEISNKRLIVPVIAASIVLLIIWIIYPEDNKLSLILSVIFILSYTSIIIWKKSDRTQLIRILSYVSIIELVVSSLLAFSSCIGYRNTTLENNIKSIQALCKENINKSKDDIYISEYLTSSEYNLNMGLITGQNTITGFQSGMSNQICSMSANWGIYSTNNYLSYGTGNPLADMMLHVRYQFLDTDDAEYSRSSIYNKLLSYNNFDLYENPYFLPIGFMTNSEFGDFATMNKADFDTMLEYQNNFSQKVCGKDLYTSIGNSKENTSVDKTFNMSVLSNDSNVYGNYDLGIGLELGDINGKIYALYKGEIKYIGDTETAIDNSFYFTLYNYPYSSFEEGPVIDIAVLNENVLKEMYETFSKSTLTDISVSRDSISGSINVSETGMMYIGLPNYDSLIVYVDGKKTDKSDYLMGTGIQINQGQHQVLIKYEDNSYIVLIALTVLFILISLLINKATKNNPK